MFFRKPVEVQMIAELITNHWNDWKICADGSLKHPSGIILVRRWQRVSEIHSDIRYIPHFNNLSMGLERHTRYLSKLIENQQNRDRTAELESMYSEAAHAVIDYYHRSK